MSYNDCSSVAFFKGRKYTRRLEAQKIAQLKACKKYKKFRERKNFHVHCMKKLANDKTRKDMAKLAKISALRRTADL